MAELTCWQCRNPIGAGTVYCPTCTADQDAAPAPESPRAPVAPAPATPATPAAPSVSPPLASTPAAGLCPNAGCGQPTFGASTCPYCGTSAGSGPAPSSRQLSLVMPTGEPIDVGADSLLLGRDEDSSPLASRLEPYGNISRSHAVITLDRGTLRITDLGSTNGTFVNDARLRPQDAMVLRRGDRVRLAATLELRVLPLEEVAR